MLRFYCYQFNMFVSHFENKIKEATNLKGQGNQFFKTQRYEEAESQYKKALELVQPHLFYGSTQQQFRKSVELRANLVFNIGLCAFNQKRWRGAEQSFSQAISINPQYIKAIYKRALTRQQREDYEGAMADIRQVYEFDKENRQFSESYERILLKKSNEFAKKQAPKKGTKNNESQQTKTKSKKEGKAQQQVPLKNDDKEKSKGGKKWLLWTLLVVAGIGVYQILKNERK